MALPKEIKEKLRKCPFEIQVFVNELQTENTKLATKNGNLTAQNITCRSIISELKKCINKQAKEIKRISDKSAVIRVVYDNHKVPS